MTEKSIAHRSSAEHAAINADVQAIRKQYPDRIRVVALFGSKVCGDDDPESDIDLLVICDSKDRQFRSALWRKASEISLDQSVLISVRVYTARHAGKRLARSGFLSPAKSLLTASPSLLNLFLSNLLPLRENLHSLKSLNEFDSR